MYSRAFKIMILGCLGDLQMSQEVIWEQDRTLTRIGRVPILYMALSFILVIVTDIQQNVKYTGISNRVTGKSLILDAACMLKHYSLQHLSYLTIRF